MTEINTKAISHNPNLKKKLATAIADRFRNDSPVDDLFKNADIKMAPWVSELSDQNKKVKYVGQPYWTKAAIEHYIKNGVKGLRHEHSVPQKLIVELLINNEKTEKTIFSILDNLVHAVIVTHEEATLLDKKWKTKMPVDIEITNDIDIIFSRYKEEKINVYYLWNGNPKKFNEKELKSLKPII